MSTKTTTQQQHPGRATARTVVQGVVATVATLGLILPTVAQIINEDLGAYLPEDWVAWLIGAAAAIAAVAGALARIMAIPAVDAALERLGLGSGPQA